MCAGALLKVGLGFSFEALCNSSHPLLRLCAGAPLWLRLCRSSFKSRELSCAVCTICLESLLRLCAVAPTFEAGVQEEIPPWEKGSRQRILLHCTTLYQLDAFDTLYQLCRCIWDAPDFNWSQVSHRILLHPALYQTTPFTTSDSSSLSSTSIHPAIHPSPSIHPSQFLSPTLNSVYISLSQISALKLQFKCNCDSLLCTFYCWSNLATSVGWIYL